jgi:uncharacterized membrane protein
MTLESNKTLGGIGGILLFIGLIPFGEPFTAILALVGLILIIVALHGFADIYKERGILNNFIYGIIAGIVGLVIAGAVVVVTVLTTLKNLLYQLYPTWNGNWFDLSGLTPNMSNFSIGTFLPLLEGILLVIIVLWVFIIIVAFFARRSLNALSAKTTVGLFSTAGLLLLIGAFLTIVIIGLLVMWIAVLLIAIAFFQIKERPEQPASTMAPPPPTSAPA